MLLRSLLVLAVHALDQLFELLVLLQSDVFGLLRSFLVSFDARFGFFDGGHQLSLLNRIAFFKKLLTQGAHSIILRRFCL